MGSPFVFLLNRAVVAAATTTVTVILATVFWRRAMKRGFVDDAPPATSDHEEAQHPDPCADNEWSIFLSHSGRQKAFVEHLYEALRGAHHNVFFDKHSLPKGSPFPPHIIRAAKSCKVGVIVLSDDFLTSKWPMLELEILVLQRGSDAIVLPLFYNLSPADLKSSTNLFKWQQVWNKIAAKHVNKWELALKALASMNGQVFIKGTSELTYIKKVVQLICSLVPNTVSNDLSLIQGHERLAKKVALQFEDAAWQSDKVGIVGLYGVRGMGKTTMCKIMCNFYHSAYSGRSYHIEFPIDGDDKKITQECTKALKTLTNLNDEHLLKKVDSFDQVVKLMKEELGAYDVFLAIDNVLASSREIAKRMLAVSFSAKSKILLTSQSEEVLKNLLKTMSSSVCALPSLDRGEALAIFQETSELELSDLDSLENRKVLQSVLERCSFSSNYHVLALKALGRYVKAVYELEGLDKVDPNSLSHFVEGIGSVWDMLRLNYENLTEEKKRMFLDIVAVLMPAEAGVTYAKARHWLSILHKSNIIASLIYELALDGLIQLENIAIDGRDEKLIRVHDLYSEFAQGETARSGRFFTDTSARCVEEIEWERLERVIIRSSGSSARFIEELQQRECPKLQVLCAENMDFRSGIQLDRMPSLCILKLARGTLASIKNWSAAKRLAVVDLNCGPSLT